MMNEMTTSRMTVTALELQKAMVLEESLEPFGINHDLYTCLAAVLTHILPRDITKEQRLEAKKALYIYCYSN